MNRIKNDNLHGGNSEGVDNRRYGTYDPAKDLIREFFRNHPEYTMTAELVDFLNADMSMDTEADITASPPIREVPSMYEFFEEMEKE